jgi:hypothetical protein
MAEEKRDIVSIGKTELTLVIGEDAQGQFSAKYFPVDAETKQPVPMRISHVVGQIIQAAMFIALESSHSISADYSARHTGPAQQSQEPESPPSQKARVAKKT